MIEDKPVLLVIGGRFDVDTLVDLKARLAALPEPGLVAMVDTSRVEERGDGSVPRLLAGLAAARWIHAGAALLVASRTHVSGRAPVASAPGSTTGERGF